VDTVCTVNFVQCCCRQDRVMLLLDTNVFHDDYNGASGGFPTLQRVIDEFGSWDPKDPARKGQAGITLVLPSAMAGLVWHRACNGCTRGFSMHAGGAYDNAIFDQVTPPPPPPRLAARDTLATQARAPTPPPHTPGPN